MWSWPWWTNSSRGRTRSWWVHARQTGTLRPQMRSCRRPGKCSIRRWWIQAITSSSRKFSGSSLRCPISQDAINWWDRGSSSIRTNTWNYHLKHFTNQKSWLYIPCKWRTKKNGSNNNVKINSRIKLDNNHSSIYQVIVWCVIVIEIYCWVPKKLNHDQILTINIKVG